MRAYAVNAQQDAPASPYMLLRRVSVHGDSLKTAAVDVVDHDGDTLAHAAETHAPRRSDTANRDSSVTLDT
mgnify:CR=1 FL=1